MKIGILTLPLHTNYGGLLQAYALQKYLTDIGHDVKILDADKHPNIRPWYIRPAIWGYHLIQRYVLHQEVEVKDYVPNATQMDKTLQRIHGIK